jgi:hypothetical protein
MLINPENYQKLETTTKFIRCLCDKKTFTNGNFVVFIQIEIFQSNLSEFVHSQKIIFPLITI